MVNYHFPDIRKTIKHKKDHVLEVRNMVFFITAYLYTEKTCSSTLKKGFLGFVPL